MNHIATTDTFFRDAPVIKSTCFICRQDCDHELGWIGERCSVCGSVYDWEITVSRIVTMRRKLLSLSRKAMAHLVGLKRSTLKQYEFVWCSKKYFDLTTKLIKEKYEVHS